MAARIEVVLGDLAEQDTDALVTAANESLLGPVRPILSDQRAASGARLGVPAERPRTGCTWVFRRCFQAG
ncbi:hypothetical protein [Kitasatospora phosalacinea]|uniref:hypothetical protein n=1 Tax=Kitasatospora phosalacinea TaxID=2065 RepID=UPI002552EEF2|nr:hypothetical protein [Kitasatospora phosalacinea]